MVATPIMHDIRCVSSNVCTIRFTTTTVPLLWSSPGEQQTAKHTQHKHPVMYVANAEAKGGGY